MSETEEGQYEMAVGKINDEPSTSETLPPAAYTAITKPTKPKRYTLTGTQIKRKHALSSGVTTVVQF